MALEKITEAQMNANGVIAAPDVLNGTAAENKAIFDRMVRSVVAPAYNACVDAVNALQALDAGLKASETGRENAEMGRVSAETARVEAELKRVAAELERVTAETDRVNAEAARENQETGYVAQANNAATQSRSWAEGGTGAREGEDTNNAKYWAERAKDTGDMKKAIYDPTGKEKDVFAYVDETLKEVLSGGIPLVDARSAEYDLNDLFKQGAHCIVYQTNDLTLNTPYAHGKTIYKAGYIISTAVTADSGKQLALISGESLMFMRRMAGGSTGEWENITPIAVETGTWTPVFDEGAVFTAADASYYKTGSVVHVSTRIYMNDSDATMIRFTGLPYPVKIANLGHFFSSHVSISPGLAGGHVVVLASAGRCDLVSMDETYANRYVLPSKIGGKNYVTVYITYIAEE